MKSATLARSIDASVCRYVDLDEFTDLLPAQILSERECERADGFRFAADKQRFVAARSAPSASLLCRAVRARSSR